MTQPSGIGASAPLQQPHPFECLRLSEICKVLGVSKPTIYRMIKAGTFPQPLKIGVRTSVWLRAEVEESLALRVSKRALTQ